MIEDFEFDLVDMLRIDPVMQAKFNQYVEEQSWQDRRLFNGIVVNVLFVDDPEDGIWDARPKIVNVDGSPTLAFTGANTPSGGEFEVVVYFDESGNHLNSKIINGSRDYIVTEEDRKKYENMVLDSFYIECERNHLIAIRKDMGWVKFLVKEATDVPEGY